MEAMADEAILTVGAPTALSGLVSEHGVGLLRRRNIHGGVCRPTAQCVHLDLPVQLGKAVQEQRAGILQN
eukprot:1157268-Pelagomonas_calceolata.AAC.3